MSAEGEREPSRPSPSARDPHPLPFQIALAGIGGLALVVAAFLLLRHPSHASTLLGPAGAWVLSLTLRLLRSRLGRRGYRRFGVGLGTVLGVAGVIAAITVSGIAWLIAASGGVLIVLAILGLPRDRTRSTSGTDDEGSPTSVAP